MPLFLFSTVSTKRYSKYILSHSRIASRSASCPCCCKKAERRRETLDASGRLFSERDRSGPISVSFFSPCWSVWVQTVDLKFSQLLYTSSFTVACTHINTHTQAHKHTQTHTHIRSPAGLWSPRGVCVLEWGCFPSYILLPHGCRVV